MSDLGPLIEQGLSVGDEPAPADRVESGSERVARTLTDDRKVGRIPIPAFIAEDSLESVWVDEGVPDRLQRDAVRIFPPEVVRAIQAGHICLRCNEPQPDAFPAICDLCGYPMKDRQIMDFAMEFDGNKHLGPTKPVSEYLEELELRAEKRRFDERAADGFRGGVLIGRSYRPKG